MKIEYLLISTFAIWINSIYCAESFKATNSYLYAIDYKYTHVAVSVESKFCDIKEVRNSGEIALHCKNEASSDKTCGCSEGTIIGLEPATIYTFVIRSKPRGNPFILKQARFHTASKYTLKSDEITSDSYEYVIEIDPRKTLLQECQVCVVEGGTTDTCCTDGDTSSDNCETKKFLNLKSKTDYDFIMCDKKGGQSIKKRFTTKSSANYPRVFDIKFKDEEVEYLLTYPNDNVPTEQCIGNFLVQGNANCKAGSKCDCSSGIFELPSNKDNLRFQLKQSDEILVDYTPDGPGENNQFHYTGSLKGQRLTTSEYGINPKKGNMGEEICNFFTHDGTPVKCQGEGDDTKIDCKCASGKLVDLLPKTEYRIKVGLKGTQGVILEGLPLKTAETGEISQEYIGLNKYKYVVKYSDENGSNKPDQCRVCLEDRTIQTECCSNDYHTNQAHCTSYEFTVPETKSKSLKLKICDLDGSSMLSKDIGIPIAPIENIIIFFEDQIRYKLKYANNDIPSNCKFLINDNGVDDLHCASNAPCDCEKGAFTYITEKNELKFTIKDFGGNELVTKELDKSKKDEYFQNKDEACSTYGI